LFARLLEIASGASHGSIEGKGCGNAVVGSHARRALHTTKLVITGRARDLWARTHARCDETEVQAR